MSSPVRHRRRLIGLSVAVAAVLAACTPPPPPGPPPAPEVTVSPAPDVGTPWNVTTVDLGPLGFTEEEFFFSGTTSVGPYTSRMLVRRPQDPRRFNGTVIVEWLNASSGFDIDVDYLSVLPLMQREGYAYVGVTSSRCPSTSSPTGIPRATAA